MYRIKVQRGGSKKCLKINNLRTLSGTLLKCVLTLIVKSMFMAALTLIAPWEKRASGAPGGVVIP